MEQDKRTNWNRLYTVNHSKRSYNCRTGVTNRKSTMMWRNQKAKVISYLSNYKNKTFTIKTVSEELDINKNYLDDILIDIYNTHTMKDLHIIRNKSKNKTYYVGDVSLLQEKKLPKKTVTKLGSTRILTPDQKRIRIRVNQNIKKQIKEQLKEHILNK